jgi:ABC-type sugar transport system permease subunit
VYVDWFLNPLISIAVIVLVEMWHNTALMTLVLLAGLPSIPQELYDAGKADGADELVHDVQGDDECHGGHLWW